jgi:hypothetical protein
MPGSKASYFAEAHDGQIRVYANAIIYNHVRVDAINDRVDAINDSDTRIVDLLFRSSSFSSLVSLVSESNQMRPADVSRS